LSDVLNTLEGGLKGKDYLVGESFTTPGFCLSSQMGWGLMTGAVEKQPVFEAYVGRLRQRPTAIKAAQIDDALIAAKQRA
jgi:glutathione S-transferase